jgi:hypothetical protein
MALGQAFPQMVLAIATFGTKAVVVQYSLLAETPALPSARLVPKPYQFD